MRQVYGFRFIGHVGYEKFHQYGQTAVAGEISQRQRRFLTQGSGIRFETESVFHLNTGIFLHKKRKPPRKKLADTGKSIFEKRAEVISAGHILADPTGLAG